ncbi:MAG: hypothetical protein HQ481_10375 [Alphaproteobacteria bacterium]|nr:hypothetical protein [Alphaproteobacteria bacterium]
MTDAKNYVECQTTKKVSIDHIRWLYTEIRAYDIHYSTVRSALSVFLIGVMFLMMRGFFSEEIKPEDKFYYAVFIAMLNFFMILINFYFQGMTYSCRKFQRIIESFIIKHNIENKKSIIEIHEEYISIREKISWIYKHKSKVIKAIQSDRPLQLVLLGTLVFWITLSFGEPVTNYLNNKSKPDPVFSELKIQLDDLAIKLDDHTNSSMADFKIINKKVIDMENTDSIKSKNDVVEIIENTWPLNYLIWY